MRVYRAGETVEDVCRACKLDRLHTVIAVDGQGIPVRVQCDYCQSQHNFRGGPAGGGRQTVRSSDAPRVRSVTTPVRNVLELVSDRERITDPVALDSRRDTPDNDVNSQEVEMDLELLLRRVIREEAGVTPVVPAEKWRGGSLVLKPGNPALQEKSFPIETLFHKIVMIRNRLRTLEQQVNASELPEDAKIKLQTYITGCYGSLTSFNVLFADEADQFRGTSGD